MESSVLGYQYNIEENIIDDIIHEKGLLYYRIQKKHLDHTIKMLIEYENYKKLYDKPIWENPQNYVIWENFSEKLSKYLEVEKNLIITPENFYLQSICNLPNVEAIICEILPDAKHFITILSKRDLETREKIYNIEMEMFDSYKDKQFRFSVNYIHKQHELNLLIKNKKVLFHKRSIYAL